MERKAKEGNVAEIEVTPKMIKAGATALAAVDLRFCSEEDAAKTIFLAMIKANKSLIRWLSCEGSVS